MSRVGQSLTEPPSPSQDQSLLGMRLPAFSSTAVPFDPRRLPASKQRLLARLSKAELVDRLVALRVALPPGVDAARVASAVPELLLGSASAAVAELRADLPGVDPVALLGAEPRLLDKSTRRVALKELWKLRSWFEADVSALLCARPHLLHQVLPPAPREDESDEYYV